MFTQLQSFSRNVAKTTLNTAISANRNYLPIQYQYPWCPRYPW